MLMCLLILLCQWIGLTANPTDLPPPYDSVELLPFNPHGWFAEGIE
jgi:hypothetical protein